MANARPAVTWGVLARILGLPGAPPEPQPQAALPSGWEVVRCASGLELGHPLSPMDALIQRAELLVVAQWRAKRAPLCEQVGHHVFSLGPRPTCRCGRQNAPGVDLEPAPPVAFELPEPGSLPAAVLEL